MEAGRIKKNPLPVLSTVANAPNKLSGAPGTSGIGDERRPFTFNESAFDKPQTSIGG